MKKAKQYQLHLESQASLVTQYAAVRAGFVSLALERNRRATPFVAQARDLKVAAQHAKSPSDLLSISHIQAALLTAAGISDKAAGHLDDSHKLEAIQGLIRDYLEPEGDNFVEELVFRFLLTRGDTLGGSMRNVGGFLAQCKLTRSILAHLRNGGIQYQWLPLHGCSWLDMAEDEAAIELNLRGISWKVAERSRTLIYNCTVPLVRNNIDLCLLSCDPGSLSKELLRSANAYLALGELKGGIDPAGADEHWKTARTALVRIQSAFAKSRVKPKTFFIGAAVENKMAGEIWSMLKTGKLDNAANLTDDDQLASMTNWICSL
jgi:hypothetical protein